MSDDHTCMVLFMPCNSEECTLLGKPWDGYLRVKSSPPLPIGYDVEVRELPGDCGELLITFGTRWTPPNEANRATVLHYLMHVYNGANAEWLSKSPHGGPTEVGPYVDRYTPEHERQRPHFDV